MNELELNLLRRETGGAEPTLCIRTGTKIDAGLWWRRTPVWLCIVGSELILLAVARRRYVERVAIADCQASHYSHAVGELILKPAEELRYGRLSLTPAEAIRVLEILKHDENASDVRTLTHQP
jgi:hypothetical protein